MNKFLAMLGFVSMPYIYDREAQYNENLDPTIWNAFSGSYINGIREGLTKSGSYHEFKGSVDSGQSTARITQIRGFE